MMYGGSASKKCGKPRRDSCVPSYHTNPLQLTQQAVVPRMPQPNSVVSVWYHLDFLFSCTSENLRCSVGCVKYKISQTATYHNSTTSASSPCPAHSPNLAFVGVPAGRGAVYREIRNSWRKKYTSMFRVAVRVLFYAETVLFPLHRCSILFPSWRACRSIGSRIPS